MRAVPRSAIVGSSSRRSAPTYLWRTLSALAGASSPHIQVDVLPRHWSAFFPGQQQREQIRLLSWAGVEFNPVAPRARSGPRSVGARTRGGDLTPPEVSMGPIGTVTSVTPGSSSTIANHPTVPDLRCGRSTRTCQHDLLSYGMSICQDSVGRDIRAPLRRRSGPLGLGRLRCHDPIPRSRSTIVRSAPRQPRRSARSTLSRCQDIEWRGAQLIFQHVPAALPTSEPRSIHDCPLCPVHRNQRSGDRPQQSANGILLPRDRPSRRGAPPGRRRGRIRVPVGRQAPRRRVRRRRPGSVRSWRARPTEGCPAAADLPRSMCSTTTPSLSPAA